MRMIVLTQVAFVTVTGMGCVQDEGEERRVWEDEESIVELVDVSESQRQALLDATKLVLKRAPSDALSRAIHGETAAATKVQLVRDKIDGQPVNETPPTYQGWVYYEPETLPDGTEMVPTVLCVSQADPIQWTHCQEMSSAAGNSDSG